MIGKQIERGSRLDIPVDGSRDLDGFALSDVQFDVLEKRGNGWYTIFTADHCLV